MEREKKIEGMTRQQIWAQVGIFTTIGGVVAAACVYKLLFQELDNLWFGLYLAGFIWSVYSVGQMYLKVFREFRRRKESGQE